MDEALTVSADAAAGDEQVDAWPADVPGSGRTRLTADERRRQLVGIGLQLLITTPIHQLSLDTVAERAGISRSLLFHHFPTKNAYYAAVVRAAFRRLLRATRPAPDTPDAERVPRMVAGLVAFIDRRREPYLALVRGAGVGDPTVRRIVEDARAELAARWTGALAATRAAAGAPVADEEFLRMSVQGWLAYAEEMALSWTADPERDRGALVVLLTAALDRLTTLDRPA